MKEIFLAGGCFWGTAHFFSGVDGVRSAVAGYANGHTPNPTYKEVYTDTTGYAETVRVTYNPEQVSLPFLVKLFFRIIDPLSLNRQGEDEGTRYRTGVYYTDPAELPVIQAVFADEARALGQPPVVELEPLKGFFPAEPEHQDYLVKNPGGYCHLPLKVFTYLRLFQDLRNLLGDEPDPVARMAEAASLIHERMHFFWVGFYRVLPCIDKEGRELVLGPFHGPVACLRIGFGRGVCGQAWQQDKTLVVPDVEAFPGHIACSSLSRSEIVVPVHADGVVTAVLDIDSTELATFDETDACWLEMIATLVR